MKGRKVVERAAELAWEVAEAESARAELESLDACLRETLAPHEGGVVDLWVASRWRSYRVEAGRLVPYEAPPKVSLMALDGQPEAAGAVASA